MRPLAAITSIDPAFLLLLAVIALAGNMLAGLAGVVLRYFYEKRTAAATVKVAQEAAKAKADNDLAQLRAKEDAAKAQKAAADAARALFEAAAAVARGQKITDGRLEVLQKIANGTHAIVNNQRTVTLRLVADLRKQIARQNPEDVEAADAAAMADREATVAEKSQAEGVGALPDLTP